MGKAKEGTMGNGTLPSTPKVLAKFRRSKILALWQSAEAITMLLEEPFCHADSKLANGRFRGKDAEEERVEDTGRRI
jgi:hypothetical protein